MKSLKTQTSLCAIALAMVSTNTHAESDFAWGSFYGDLRLRYESVTQDNDLEDASALTLRTKLGYISPEAAGISGLLELEDSRPIIDDYAVPPTGFQTGEYSVIADPESTELDQVFVQYKVDGLVAKLGRQVITMDNHRFVGHVGWRQDRQTFDALSLKSTLSEQLSAELAYITKRNRIFADEADLDAKDILLNGKYKSSKGALTAYAYLLELDNETDNGLDTYGVRYTGKVDKISYQAEFASQTKTAGDAESKATYMFLEGGYNFGPLTAKLGYEVLGSDDGSYGFSTPLATLHKFNGWSDQFLGTPNEGLTDIALTLVSKVGGGKLLFAYHNYSAADASDTVDDLGSEINVLYAKKFAKKYATGIKYSQYTAGDIKVDTDKLWVWGSVGF